MEASSRRSVGQVHTTHYDVTRLGTWQELEGEFRVPDDAQTFWLALEKGTNGLAEIDAYLDEIRLEPIAQLSVIRRYLDSARDWALASCSYATWGLGRSRSSAPARRT
jgi:hypothetical protein